MVPCLMEVDQPSPHFVTKVRHYEVNGQPQGEELTPFSESFEVLGRPDIAYSPLYNIYYLAVPVRDPMYAHEYVLVRPLSSTGGHINGEIEYNSPCDSEPDGDVDGVDLAEYANSF